MKLRKLVGFVISLGFIGAVLFGVSKSQNIIDWWALRDYQPSPAIENLATNSSMSDEGRKLFYIHDPALLGKATFGSNCTVGEETIVLGCYISRQKIYIFDVVEERLIGVEEVTAAHEMLHAAYDRLSIKEKAKIDEMVESAFKKLDDQRIIVTVKSYEERDPSSVPNELHSILGTEVRELPDDLEEYYSRYFMERQKVVTLSEVYAEEFEKLEAQIAVYDKQLASLQGEIARLEADISLQSQALAQERHLILNLADNPSAYNQAVGAYNKKIVSYNVDVENLKNLINQHNSIVTERNKIASEERALVDAIDTRASTL